MRPLRLWRWSRTGSFRTAETVGPPPCILCSRHGKVLTRRKEGRTVRAQMTLTDLDDDRWNYLQRNVRAEYQIPEGATRLCLTFSRGTEERHVEMPLGALIGLLVGLGMTGAFSAMTGAMDKIKKATEETDQPKPYGFDSDGNVVALDQDGNS